MKNNSKLFLLGLSCLLGLATACSEEEVMKQDNQNDASNIEAGSLKEALVTVSDFEPAWKARTVISMENGKGNFNWADGDKIGVFPTKANDITTLKSQHVLTLRNVNTANKATFQQDGWSFTPGYDYVAHYPIINRAQIQMKEVPADYSHQTYTVPTNGKINLSAVDYMVANSTAPEQGKIPFNFKHLGCLMELVVYIPKAGTTLESFELSEPSGSLYLTGTYDLTQKDCKFIPSTTDGLINVNVSGLTTTQDNQEVKLYFMLPPTPLKDKIMSLTLRTSGTESLATQVVKFLGDLEAGKYYQLNVEKNDTYITVDPTNHCITTQIPGLITRDHIVKAVNGQKSLTVVGPINGTDFKALREAAGSNYIYDDKTTKDAILTELDLSAAKFLKGGVEYTKADGTPFTLDEDNMLGVIMFGNSSLTQLTLPEGLLKIGMNALDNNRNLTTINIPSTVQTIGDFAFVNTKIVEITIPNSIKNLGRGIFNQCKELQRLNLPDSPTFTEIPYQFCNYCTKLTSVTIPNTVQTIGEHAFQSSGIKTITIPASVQTISKNAFMYSAIETITIPETVQTIEGYILAECPDLRGIRIEGVKGNRNFVNEAFCSILDNQCTLAIHPSWKDDIEMDELSNLYFKSKSNYNNTTYKGIFKSITDLGGNDLRPDVNTKPGIEDWKPGQGGELEAE